MISSDIMKTMYQDVNVIQNKHVSNPATEQYWGLSWAANGIHFA
jgi:hypothetical protein